MDNLERSAKVAERWLDEGDFGRQTDSERRADTMARDIAAAIRALKPSRVEEAREMALETVVNMAKCAVRQYPNMPRGLKSAVENLLAAEAQAGGEAKS